MQVKVMENIRQVMALHAYVIEMQATMMEMQAKIMEMQRNGNRTVNTTSSCCSQPPAVRRVGHLAWPHKALHNTIHKVHFADLHSASLEQAAKAATMLTRKSQKYMQK